MLRKGRGLLFRNKNKVLQISLFCVPMETKICSWQFGFPKRVTFRKEIGPYAVRRTTRMKFIIYETWASDIPCVSVVLSIFGSTCTLR